MSSPKRIPRIRLTCISLEPRIVPATISWDGGGDNTTWTDARNWTGDVLPGTADDAVLNMTANPAVVISGAIAVKSIVSTDNLELRSGSLTTSQGISQSGRTLKLTSGTITAGTGIALGSTGSLRIEAGANTIVGAVNLAGSSTVSLADGITGAASFRLSATTATFGGFIGGLQTVAVVADSVADATLQVAAGQTLVNRGTISLQTTGTKSDQLRVASGGLFVNADSGLLDFQINSGSGMSFLTGGLENYGLIRIGSTTFLQQSAATDTFNNFGILRLDASIASFSVATTNNVGAYIGGAAAFQTVTGPAPTNNGTIDSTGPALAEVRVGTSAIRVVLTDAVGFMASTVTDPANYRLIRSGFDATFGNAGDVDMMPSVSGIAYDAPSKTATLSFSAPLPADRYRLTLKAATILNSSSVALNSADIPIVLLPGALPATPTVTLLPSSDSGFSSTDGRTNLTAQTFAVFFPRGGLATFDGTTDGIIDDTANPYAASYGLRTTNQGPGTFVATARLVIGASTQSGMATVTVDLTQPAASSSNATIVAAAVTSRAVSFSEAIDPTTMTTANVTVTGPSGNLAVTSVGGSGASWTIGFASSSTPGIYRIRFAGGVRDIAGNGLSSAADTETFTLALPTPIPTPTPPPATPPAVPTPPPATPPAVPTPPPAIPAKSIIPADIAIGSQPGDAPIVRVFRADGTLKSTLMPFGESFRSGVRTAMADFDGDGIADLLVATGPGAAPHVKLIRGSDNAELMSFFAYGTDFTGGVEIAIGDINNDGTPDIITGAGAGAGSHVRVFDGRTGAEIVSFFAYDPAFQGGVRVAAGDLNNDGRIEIVTTPEVGAPHVKAFDPTTLAVVRSFFAYDPSFGGGVSIAVGDVDGDGFGDILTGVAANGPSHTKLFDGRSGAERQSFFAYDPAYGGGERVSFVRTPTGIDLVTVSRGPAHTRVFDPLTLGETASFFGQPPTPPSGFFGG